MGSSFSNISKSHSDRSQGQLDHRSRSDNAALPHGKDTFTMATLGPAKEPLSEHGPILQTCVTHDDQHTNSTSTPYPNNIVSDDDLLSPSTNVHTALDDTPATSHATSESLRAARHLSSLDHRFDMSQRAESTIQWSVPRTSDKRNVRSSRTMRWVEVLDLSSSEYETDDQHSKPTPSVSISAHADAELPAAPRCTSFSPSVMAVSGPKYQQQVPCPTKDIDIVVLDDTEEEHLPEDSEDGDYTESESDTEVEALPLHLPLTRLSTRRGLAGIRDPFESGLAAANSDLAINSKDMPLSVQMSPRRSSPAPRFASSLRSHALRSKSLESVEPVERLQQQPAISSNQEAFGRAGTQIARPINQQPLSEDRSSTRSRSLSSIRPVSRRHVHKRLIHDSTTDSEEDLAANTTNSKNPRKKPKAHCVPAELRTDVHGPDRDHDGPDGQAEGTRVFTKWVARIARKTRGGPSEGERERRRRRRQKQSKKRADIKREKVAIRAREACKYAGLPVDESDNITVIRCKYNPELRRLMEGKGFKHDDPVFTNGTHTWRRIGGKGSGLVFVVDADSGELVFGCRITEHKDMTPLETDTFQKIFDYFQEDKRFHRKCQINGAHIKGTMVAIGWRKAMIPGEAFGTYAAKHVNTADFLHHSFNRGAEIHRLYSERFKLLAPALQHHQVLQHADMLMPAVGYGNGDNLVGEEVFCSNLAYTRDDFENKGHCDQDESTYTFGIGGNVFAKDTKMASFSQGYQQKGGFFYIADYGFIIDYSRIDGVVEQVWQGPNHVHSTVGGTVAEGFTRVGSTCQINRRLARAVRTYLAQKTSSRRFVMDDLGRFLLAGGDSDFAVDT